MFVSRYFGFKNLDRVDDAAQKASINVLFDFMETEPKQDFRMHCVKEIDSLEWYDGVSSSMCVVEQWKNWLWR